MRLLVDFRKPFVELEQALLLEDCTLVRMEHAALPFVGDFDACLVDFCDSARHLWRLHRIQRACRKKAIPLIGIDRDAPWHKGVKNRQLWLVAKFLPFDVYASHSTQEGKRFGAPLYLPNAARTESYHLYGQTLEALRQPAFYRHDVSFIGNLNAECYPEHRARVAFLTELQARLKNAGIELALFDSAGMTVPEQVDIIQRSRVNLNCGAAADNGGIKSWGLPERCYGIPACGGFLLADRREHAATDFISGVDWVDFADMNDCLGKIQYFLRHFSEARDIAESAHKKVMAEHCYSQRARRLLQAIESWKSACT